MNLIEPKQLQPYPSPILSLPQDAQKLIAFHLISDPDSLFVYTNLTCKKIIPLACDIDLWRLVFKSYLPSIQTSNEGLDGDSFQRQLRERVIKLNEYLTSLKLDEINPILEAIKTKKTPFQILQTINTHSDAIFTAICNSMSCRIICESRLTEEQKTHERIACVNWFMGYFKNALPLPTALALASQLRKIIRQKSPVVACLSSYYKNNQTSVLVEAINIACKSPDRLRDEFASVMDDEDPYEMFRIKIQESIIKHVRSLSYSEMLQKEGDCFPSIFDFITDYLQPACDNVAFEEVFYHILNTLPSESHEAFYSSIPKRSYPFILALGSASASNELIVQQNEYACPELDIDGGLIIYGSENDQLLKDFEVLCSLPGVDLHARNEMGQTPLELAMSLKMDDAAEIIKKALNNIIHES